MWKILEYGHFEILMRSDGSPEELGRGAMGITYKALDRNLLSVVVVKAMQGEHLHDEAARKQFLIEAQAMAKIRHPHVPSIYFLGDSNQGCFYAMEFCQGPNLQQYVQAKGALSPVEVFKIAAQLGSALAAVAHAGFVHRDIKPANVLVTQSSSKQVQIKLIDFGLARNYAIDLVKEHESFAGTPVFASPEQFDPELKLDVRADLYSIGMVMWYLLTGAPPYHGSLLELMKAQTFEPLPWDQLLDLPEPFREVLETTLAKKPADRYASAEAFEAAVRTALGEEDRFPLVLDTDSVILAERNAGVIGDFPFEILEEKAELTFGKRFLGKDLQTERTYALYLLHPRFGAHPKVLEAIQSVRKKLRRRTHPHLMRITAQSQFQDRLVYALDSSLEDHISFEAWCYRHRSSPLEAHLRMLCQLADAMDFATELGLVHVPASLQRVWVRKTSLDEASVTWHPMLEPLDPELVLQPDIDEVEVLRRYLSLVVQTLSLFEGKQRDASLDLVHELVKSQRIQYLDSCREVLEAIALPQGLELPELEYSFLEVQENPLETLDHAPTVPGSTPDQGGDSFPGLGSRMNSLWSEVLAPLPPTDATEQAPALSSTLGSVDSLDDLATLVAKPQGLQKAMEALDDGAQWLHQKKDQLEDQLKQMDEVWDARADHFAKELASIESQRNTLAAKKREKREVELQLLAHAQQRFLQLASGNETQLERWSMDQQSLELALESLVEEIESLELEVHRTSADLSRRAHSAQRDRDHHRLDRGAEIEELQEESERLEKKRLELDQLLAQLKAGQRRRALGWSATVLVAIALSTLVAYYMKGRIQDVRVVPGEQAWSMLQKERNIAEQEKDWPALIHWLAVTQRQASNDPALSNFVKRHLDAFHQALGRGVKELGSTLGQSPIDDKPKLMSDLRELSTVGFTNDIEVLLARLELEDLLKARNWASALEHFHTLRRITGEAALKQVQPEMQQLLESLGTSLREDPHLPQAQATLQSIRAILPSDKTKLGADLIREIELGLSIGLNLNEGDRLSALQELVQLGRLNATRPDRLLPWTKLMDQLLEESSLAPEQLMQEHTLWAEIARLWKYARPLEILVGTQVVQPVDGSQRTLLPESVKTAYLKLAQELGSESAEKWLNQQQEAIASQQTLVEQANAWLNGDASVKGEVNLPKARSAALGIQNQDFRKWMMLGLVAGAESETFSSVKAQRAKIQEATGLFLMAGAQGYARGYFYASKCLESLKEREAYLKVLELGADSNDPECAHTLGLEWLETSENRSMTWFIRAASLGHEGSREYCRKYRPLMEAAGFKADLDRLKL